MPPGPPLLQMIGITKRFGDVLANSDVSLTVPGGQVVALLGENGAGKSTAMNVLCGLYLPEAGSIRVDGVQATLGSPRAALEAGIGMVHQQFKLVEPLTAFENISLAVDRGRLMQPRQLDPRIRDLIADVGFEIDLSAPVWQMSLAARQQLEILRVLAQGARLLILDEPTSVLSPLESRKLFEIVRRIALSGRSVILISHKLAEIRDVSDSLVVMRDGKVVFQGANQGMDDDDVAALIVGSRVFKTDSRPQVAKGARRLSVEHLVVPGRGGQPAVRDVSFDVHGGEVVALIGVTGNGQSELLDAIAGLLPVAGGRIDAPFESGQRGFAYIPSQHLGTALAPNLSVAANAMLGLQRYQPFGAWISGANVMAQATKVISAFGVKTDHAATVRRLSGGNLQRLVLGRELSRNPDLILASYPTRGLDIASAAQIRNALIARAAAGAAVLMASEELEESMGIATRILVMSGGQIVADCDPSTISLDEVGRLMTAARSKAS